MRRNVTITAGLVAGAVAGPAIGVAVGSQLGTLKRAHVPQVIAACTPLHDASVHDGVSCGALARSWCRPYAAGAARAGVRRCRWPVRGRRFYTCSGGHTLVPIHLYTPEK